MTAQIIAVANQKGGVGKTTTCANLGTAVTSVDTASEALSVSISEKARVDMEYMSALTGKDEQTLAAELQGVVFLDFSLGPGGFHTYRTADDFLSGNVREKLHKYQRIMEGLAPDDPLYAAAKINAEALRAAQPKDLDASEIDVRLGATWVCNHSAHGRASTVS